MRNDHAILATLVLPFLLGLGCTGTTGDGDTAAGSERSISLPGMDAGSEGPRWRSESHIFEEVAPGVYFATAAGAVNLVSNAMVVVNDEDVLLVDSHITPDAARGLIEAVKAITDKPVRYVVNSHYHFDHAHGNQIFPEGVKIIGHEFTREKLLGDVLEEDTYKVIGSPEYEESLVAALELQLGDARSSGSSEDEERAAQIEAQIAMMKRHITALGEVVPTPPNVTLVKQLTLFRGDREIQIHHLGRGHTGGDVVVLLPAERILFTGDLFYDGAPYLGDSYPLDFVDTLESLEALPFDLVVPGHGPLIRDRSKIDFAQEYLGKYWEQVKALHASGRSAEQAALELDMPGYEEYAAFQFTRPEVRLLEVKRMYHFLEGGS